MKKFPISIIEPIWKELPFFVIALFLLIPNTLKNLVVYLYDYSRVIDSLQYISQAFLFSYIFALILYVSKSRLLKITFYTFLVSLFIVYVFLWVNFHTTIQPALLLTILETNPDETKEFFQTFLISKGGGITVLALLLLIILIFKLEKFWKNNSNYHQVPESKLLKVFVVALLICGSLSVKSFVSLYSCKTTSDIEQWTMKNNTFAMDNLSNLIYSLYTPIAATQDIKIAVEKTKAIMKTRHECSEDSLIVVYVIGESYIKSHAHLYGYPLHTTPHLDKEKEKGNLFIFDDVISRFSLTGLVMKNTFSCNSMEVKENWFEKPYFPAIFKATGYDVFFWNMQKDIDTTGSVFSFSVNSFLYNPEIIELSYTDYNKETFKYDEDLVDHFLANVNITNPLNFVMFHLMGQHHATKERFPNNQEFQIFNTDSVFLKASYLDEGKKAEIASYDNATYYNDYVLGKIIDVFREKNAVLVYFSDHGEEVYDYRDSEGRVDPSGDIHNYLKCLFDVPFVIWCSDKYVESHPEIVKNIQASTNKPFTTDNICQVLFHLAGIKSEYYVPERDILSKKHIIGRRVIYGYDYDSICKSK